MSTIMMVTREKPLGKGTYGEVYAFKMNEENYVLKILPSGNFAEIGKEIKILKEFSGIKQFPEFFECTSDRPGGRIVIIMKRLYKDLSLEGREEFLLKIPFQQRLGFYIDLCEGY